MKLLVFLPVFLSLVAAILIPFHKESIRVEAQKIIPQRPVKLTISKINLATQIETVGLNEKGLTTVPDNTVGWHKGTPVFVGHSTGIFNNLNQLAKDDIINITDSTEKSFNYKITDIKYYPVDKFPVAEIYGMNLGKDLNLITCAGLFNPLSGIFPSRLVIYSEIIN